MGAIFCRTSKIEFITHVPISFYCDKERNIVIHKDVAIHLLQSIQHLAVVNSW